jgi:hypothetical protein
MARRQPVRASADEPLNKGEGGEMKYDDDKEYDKDGKESEGGGFRKAGGKLYKMEKSEDLTQDDLEKSLDRLQTYAEEGDQVSRKEALLSKAATEELEKSEREELFELLGGEATPADEPSLGEEIVKSMDENETLQKALDVSDFLQEQHGELCKSLQTLADHQEESDKRQHEFNLVLAKAVADVGNLVKSMAEQMGATLAEPARAPKSRGVNAPAPLNKSFAGAAPEGEELTKSDMMKGLETLMQETMEKSGGESRLDNGVDLLMEISKFEQTGFIHPQVEEIVKSRIMSQRAAH